MKPEETIFDGISDSEMESISGGIAEVQSVFRSVEQPKTIRNIQT